MSLPSALSSLRAPTAGYQTSASGKPDAAAAGSFAAHADALSETPVALGTSSVRGHRELPGYGRIETLTVTETTLGPDGKAVSTVKELAVCPECGTANCACLARVTLQSRLDEENAKGPRDKEQPKPYSVLPQSFNQMSANFSSTQSGSPSGAAQGTAPPRLFG